MYTIKRVSSDEELAAIKKLQDENLKRNLPEKELDAEGFLTAEYSLNFLKVMHQTSPSIIAKDGEVVIGYALVVMKSICIQHELLSDLATNINKIMYKNKLLQDEEYVLVGQVCIAKKYKGKGLVKQIYQHFQESLSQQFKYCITDVSSDNIRSLKAHEACGFKVLESISYGGVNWHIILWDWGELLSN